MTLTRHMKMQLLKIIIDLQPFFQQLFEIMMVMDQGTYDPCAKLQSFQHHKLSSCGNSDPWQTTSTYNHRDAVAPSTYLSHRSLVPEGKQGCSSLERFTAQPAYKLKQSLPQSGQLCLCWQTGRG